MKWLHNLLKGASLSGALFVFQACYGMPQSPLYEEEGTAPMSFSLVNHATGEPLNGIRILYNQDEAAVGKEDKYFRELGVTGENGRCRVNIPYRRNAQGPCVRFEDPTEKLALKDTVLYDLRDREITVKLDEAL